MTISGDTERHVVKRSRGELMQTIRSGFQQTSGQSVLLSHIIADKAGVSPTDLECMGFLEDGGPMTAGHLGELTGLTRGAGTGRGLLPTAERKPADAAGALGGAICHAQHRQARLRGAA